MSTTLTPARRPTPPARATVGTPDHDAAAPTAAQPIGSHDWIVEAVCAGIIACCLVAAGFLLR